MTKDSGKAKKSTRKDLGNFEGMWHSGFASHFRAGGSGYSKGLYNPLNALLPGHLVAWIPHVIRYWFRKPHNFRDYTRTGHGTGIYTLEEKVTLSVAGDWATGTDEAQKVADCIQRFEPDFTVHLGDVYFVGDETEVKENFLGEATSPYSPVKWPVGKLGSFALSGNHEMYARGMGYFNSILPKMGLKKRGEDWGSGQWASFFCLENKYWRVIGLDTGYNGTRFDWGKMPVVEKSKWIRKSTWFKPRCTLPEPMLSWLERTVNPDGDNRGLILLTHHGCYSAFSDWYQIPAKQLANMIHRPVIWFWGHEHKLAIYDRYSVQDGIEAYGRCIGHAGMPVERGSLPDIECPWLAWDNRRYDNGEDINVGFNGHVNLSLDGPALHADYLDLNCKLLLTEDWQVDLTSGTLQGPNLKKVLHDPSLHFRAIDK
jgi:hypothetical protein